MGSFNTKFEEGFVLVGFSDWPQLELTFFVSISIFLLLTLFGNTTITALSRLDPRLHMPMYFFLCCLSFLDLCYTTSTMPQLGVIQLFIYLSLGGTECVLLFVMAIDHYAAVCHPLHYTTNMNSLLCLINSLIQTSFMMAMPFCGLHYLHHFFCEMPLLQKLACEDTGGIEAYLFVAEAIILVFPVVLILGSCTHISWAVLRIKSMAGHRKAFGTCGSHLCFSEIEGKFVALLYTFIIPMFNSLIYTLRNKYVKGALWKVLRRDRDSR
ncbi:hypothetical protein H1C71_002078 [Ictidomys tridecemlineatus]|uniref:G-protein coupled receptors family 1 profile domain-containing protein n=1 Tax=Ictidomys tridecemlineatus TaxID=43179 RepID=A0A287DDG8_ICTTR|nr:hypothetical protein H1C71_002078 [Ictidomys tridecemlineatus]